MADRLLAATIAALVLAGCSGGTTSLTALGGDGGAQRTPLTITLGGTAPSSAARSPQYIPTQTNTLGIKVGTDVRDATTGAYTNTFPSPEAFYDVSAAPSNANCKPNGNGSRTCTVYIAVQPGSHVALQFDAFKEPYAQGFSAADPLATATLEDQVVTPGASSAIDVSLSGVPATMKWFYPMTLVTSDGLPSAGTNKPYMFDASGQVIVGAYASPVTLTLHEVNGSGHLKIATVHDGNVGPLGSTAVVTSTADSVYVHYDGWAGPANPDVSKPYYAYFTGLQVTNDQPDDEINAFFLSPAGFTTAAPDDLVVGGGAQSATQFIPYEHGKASTSFTVDMSQCAAGQFALQGYTISAVAPGPACPVVFKDDAGIRATTYVRSNGTPITITIH